MYKVGMGHKPPIPDKVSPEGKDFLCHCLESDPKMRWTASQLLDHPFVKVCLMTLATKSADGNGEQLLVGFFVLSDATGVGSKVRGWQQVDAVQETWIGNYPKARIFFSKHVTIGHAINANFYCCFKMHYLYVKKTNQAPTQW